jgi:hypothetical protein
MVATPGAVGEEDEITTASDCGCAGGPVGLMGVTTGRYELPHPATRTPANNTAPAFTNRERAWPDSLEKSVIQFFPAYSVIVNQATGVSDFRRLP